MKVLKRLGLIVAAIAIFFGISVMTANAQYSRNGSWQNRGDYNRQYPNSQNRNWRRGRLSERERERLQRQRERISDRRDRYDNDGRISYKERRKLQKMRQKYRRNVRRDRRDWN